MPLSIPYASLTRTVAFCAIGILLGSPSFGQDSHPNDYIRSTRTLKSGGSITTLSSQGQTRSWVNQPTTAPNARVASRDVGSNAPRSSSSTSFYRQAQSNGTGEPTYPYPGAALPSTANTPSRFASDQSAQLRFERAAVGDLNTGDLGNTATAQSLPANFGRQAAVPTPAARVAQVPAGSQSRNSVVNPNATAAAFNSGPNYVNPNLNFAGYQGYQPSAISTNSNLKCSPFNRFQSIIKRRPLAVRVSKPHKLKAFSSSPILAFLNWVATSVVELALGFVHCLVGQQAGFHQIRWRQYFRFAICRRVPIWAKD